MSNDIWQPDAPVVSLERVSKRFRLNPETDRSLISLLRRPFSRLPFVHRKEADWFWPLQDISFAIQRGESVGILGENGSGKSTLLKLIAGILEPTHGAIEVHGRIAALLELGAGFHPDLTGRENIYLNGSILGLGRQEISSYIDQIIEFAGIGEFIDVPVKLYSSGMRVRLGFSIAAFVKPDIMLVDEVLAVGDEDFQHKCVLVFHDFRRRGGTLILVSHSVELVRDMCRRTIWLDDGRIQADGATSDVIAQYMRSVYRKEQERFAEQERRSKTAEAGASSQGKSRVGKDATGAVPATTAAAAPNDPDRWGDGAVQFDKVRLLNGAGQPCEFLYTGDTLTIEAEYTVQRPIADPPIVGFAFIRHDGIWSFGTNTEIEAIPAEHMCAPGHTHGTVIVTVPALTLLPGTYTLDLALQKPTGGDHDYRRSCARLTVGSLKRDVGVARIEHRWAFKS